MTVLSAVGGILIFWTSVATRFTSHKIKVYINPNIRNIVTRENVCAGNFGELPESHRSKIGTGKLFIFF